MRRRRWRRRFGGGISKGCDPVERLAVFAGFSISDAFRWQCWWDSSGWNLDHLYRGGSSARVDRTHDNINLVTKPERLFEDSVGDSEPQADLDLDCWCLRLPPFAKLG